MKNKPQSLINIQALPEHQRAKYRGKVYDCYKAGMTKYAAAKKCRIQETTVGRWYRNFAAKGADAIRGGKRGPKPGGEKHKLSDAQMKELKKVVVDKTPDQLKFDFALWSSKAIKEYVQRKYGMSISRRTARRYMRRMGFTYQCPVKAAREQNPALVKKWLEENKGRIRLFYLPSYSQELNPDEYLNRDVKASLAEKRRPSSAKALKEEVSSHLSAKQSNRDAIKRLFHKKEVRYAAE